MTPSAEELDAFHRHVLTSPTLQARLQAEQDLHGFVPLVVELGAASGFTFSAEDVRDAIRENRRRWVERWVV